MNVPKVKGTHNAMKTAMLAAECAVEALNSDQDTKGDFRILRMIYRILRVIIGVYTQFATHTNNNHINNSSNESTIHLSKNYNKGTAKLVDISVNHHKLNPSVVFAWIVANLLYTPPIGHFFTISLCIGGSEGGGGGGGGQRGTLPLKRRQKLQMCHTVINCSEEVEANKQVQISRYSNRAVTTTLIEYSQF